MRCRLAYGSRASTFGSSLRWFHAKRKNHPDPVRKGWPYHFRCKTIFTKICCSGKTMKHPTLTKSGLERKLLLSKMPLCNMVRNFALFEMKLEPAPYMRLFVFMDTGRSMFANFFRISKHSQLVV